MARTGKVVLYLLYFAAVVTLSTAIVMSARSNSSPAPTPRHALAVQQPAHHLVTPKPKAGTAIAKAGSHTAPAPTPTPTPAPTSPPASTPAPTPTPNPSTTTNNSVATETLLNTGPGNVMRLFVVTSSIGAVAYRYRLSRKVE